MIGITRFAVNPKITATDSFSQNCSSSLFLPTRRVLSLCFMSQIGSSTYTGEAVLQASFPVQRTPLSDLFMLAGNQLLPRHLGKAFP
ncbi:hypothetical protein L7P61_16485 [Aeromonas veronii bv. sobria]|uniref:hypothetical protein n=1 Tax=Aeromonas veronii TaxID=654 RepID=UPI001068CAAF|nr:hypothetical protein [Aeromonas veronii]